MGIIAGIAGKAVAKAAATAAVIVAAPIADKISEGGKKHHKSNNGYHLILKTNFSKRHPQFFVTDEYDHILYRVKGTLNPPKCDYTILASDKKLTASVLGKPCKSRPSFSSKRKYMDYRLSVNDTVVGHMISDTTEKTQQYNIDFAGWHVAGNIFKSSYSIEDCNNNVIMKIARRSFLGETSNYDLTVFSSDDEIVGLLIVLAIDANNSRRNQSKASRAFSNATKMLRF